MRDRRPGITVIVTHGSLAFPVTFNVDPDTGRFAECFYSDDGTVKHGSDANALISDACISISKRIEHGESFTAVAASLGEDRPPGALSGPPSSLLGAIARMGSALDAEDHIDAAGH